jgi:hypothetical protein
VIRRLVAAVWIGAVVIPVTARAQTIKTEADVSVGRSTDGTDAAATQLRVFGPLNDSWRVFLEAAWGDVSTQDSDAFGTAYPYDGRVRPMEAFIERLRQPQKSLLGIRVGRYRTPFGISGRSDYAYAGFTRPPLIRYEPTYGLSNVSFEGGVDVIVGRPALDVEGSVGTAADAGPDHRRPGADIVVRTQGYYHSVILGVSYLNTPPSMPGTFVHGRTAFGGIDARWMLDGIELKGEWADGEPFDGVVTRGGYLDLMVHERRLGPVTPVARVEYLDYSAGPYSEDPRRVTAGIAVRLDTALTGQLDVLHQGEPLINGRRTGLDVGLTYTFRR